MEVNRVNTVNYNNNYNKKNTSFGHVIPVSVKLDGKMLEQSLENKKLFDSLVKRFSIMFNRGKGVYAGIAEKFKKVDTDFDGKINSIRGPKNSLWARRRYIVTGQDRLDVKVDGRNIGWQPGDTSREIYRQNEVDMRKDEKKLIKGVTNFTIDVTSRDVKHKDGTVSKAYDIAGGHFMINKSAYEDLTGIKIPPKSTGKAVQQEMDFSKKV